MLHRIWSYIYRAFCRCLSKSGRQRAWGICGVLLALTACYVPSVNAPVSPMVMPIAVGEPVGGGFVLAYPASLEDLISHADLIFTGEVGPVMQYLEYCGYDKDGQLLEKCVATDDAGNALPGLPATDFLLQVDEVFRDDGTIASGEPIILRESGHVTAELKQMSQATEFPLSYTGDRYLFLLGRNPDGKTYGFHFVWSQLIVDGDVLRVSNGTQQPLQFGDEPPITLGEFIKAVKGR